MSILHISTANVAYIHIYLHVRIINCADVCDRDHLVCCVKYHLHSSTSHHITSSSQFCRLLCLRVRRSLTLSLSDYLYYHVASFHLPQSHHSWHCSQMLELGRYARQQDQQKPTVDSTLLLCAKPCHQLPQQVSEYWATANARRYSQ